MLKTNYTNPVVKGSIWEIIDAHTDQSALADAMKIWILTNVVGPMYGTRCTPARRQKLYRWYTWQLRSNNAIDIWNSMFQTFGIDNGYFCNEYLMPHEELFKEFEAVFDRDLVMSEYLYQLTVSTILRTRTWNTFLTNEEALEYATHKAQENDVNGRFHKWLDRTSEIMGYIDDEVRKVID